MGAHNVKTNLFDADNEVDPGASGTIRVYTSPCIIGLASATTETRTLARPTKAGAKLTLYMRTDAGDITLTVTGGYNETGTTTFTFSDPGQFAEFVSAYESAGGTYYWRLTSSYLNDNTAGVFTSLTATTGTISTLSTATETVTALATPASVATSPGTAQTAAFTLTGGVGGNSTIATTGVGGVGGGISLTLGAGGVSTAATTAATGGAGGAYSFTSGAGGAEAVAGVTSTGGAGGAFGVTTGAGGAVSAAVSGTATGGASGAITVASGTGGAVTATTGTNVGGASGAVSILTGTGGAATGGTDTGGASGTLTIGTGTGGAGDTGGASGALTLQTGAAGAGGSPAVGIIAFSPGTSEKWRITSVGVLNSLATTPSNAATADGAVLATGGLAFTDVANAWIDDATQGNGTVQHFIGNNTIDTSAPSDRKLKKNIKPTEIVALPKILALEMVDFNWRDEDADQSKQFGWIAQQVREVIPELVPDLSGSNGILYVKKHNIVTYLVKALQELHAEVAALKAKIR